MEYFVAYSFIYSSYKGNYKKGFVILPQNKKYYPLFVGKD
jgi:hypothetical protein